MPYRVTFELDAFNGPRDRDESLEMLGAMLDCLVRINEIYLRNHPETPLLSQAGVRYEEEPIGAEFFRDIPSCLRYTAMGLGLDCEDLACWLVAEKRVRFGIPARWRIHPQLQQLPNGQWQYLYHIDVLTPDAPGGFEDPSRRYGMK